MTPIDYEIQQIENFVFLSTALILVMVLLFIFMLVYTKRKIYLEEIKIRVIKNVRENRLSSLHARIQKIKTEIASIASDNSSDKKKSEET